MKFIVNPLHKSNYDYCFCMTLSGKGECTKVCNNNCGTVCNSNCGNVGGEKMDVFGTDGLFGKGGLFGKK